MATPQPPVPPQPSVPPVPPVMSQTTQTKVEIAKEYTRQYYAKVTGNPREFIREHSRARPRKVCVDDFEMLSVIGRGAYGEVRLCYKKKDPRQTIYAIKVLRKDYMIRRRQVRHVHAEKNLMAAARGKLKWQGLQASAWLVELLSSFQDEDCLYFVMEYCPGGDLMWWLMKLDIFDGRVARFYTAELVEAVHALHKLNYAHRDLKPDNILLDRHGHIKLTDFGLCKEYVPEFASDSTARPAEHGGHGHDGEAHGGEGHGGQGHCGGPPSPLPAAAAPAVGAPVTHRDPAAGLSPPGPPAVAGPPASRPPRSREMFFTKVGSPGYMAPEVIEGRGYSTECDWWAVGIILYEMLCGYPPFNGDGGAQTAHKIIHWQQYLAFPDGVDAIDPVARDLICRLLCQPGARIGYDAIVEHPFFTGVDFRTVRSSVAPFKVTLKSPTDTSHFDDMSHSPGAAQHHGGGAPATTARPHSQGDSRFLFYGFTTKFDAPAVASSKVLTCNGSAGGSGVRHAAPPIPDFDGLS